MATGGGDEIRAMLQHMRRELGAVLVGGAEPKTAVWGSAGDVGERLARFNLLSAAPNWETDEVYLRYRRRTAETD